jgi:uncharacterized protein DUF6504
MSRLSRLSRRVGVPVRVQLRHEMASLAPSPGTDETYQVRVLSVWKLATRWWVLPAEERETGKGLADRTYYRVETADHQIFELYRDDAQGGVWVLDLVQD